MDKEQKVSYKINDVDFSKLKFSKTKNNSGKRFIQVYLNKLPLLIKLPKLRIPFDTKVNQFGALEINVSVGENEDLIKAITELDSQMEKFAVEHAWDPSGKLEYSPMLRKSFTGNFPPTLKMKVKINKDSKIETVFYDENKQLIEVNDVNDIIRLVTKGTQVLSAIECVGVWFMGDKYGLSWKAEQIKIASKSTQGLDDFAFESDSDCSSNSDIMLLSDDE